MSLKRYVVFLGMIMVPVLTATAQIHGLPVADAPTTQTKGSIDLTPCLVLSEDSTLYGGRIAYGATESLLLFIDLGSYKTDYAPAETMGQLGVRYVLPVDLPVNLSLRATAIPYIASFEYYVELTFGLLASYELGVDHNWSIYGSAGVVYQEWELELALDAATAELTGQDTYVDEGDQADPSFALGAIRKLSDTSSIFLEMAYVDDLFGGIGIRWGL